MLFYCSFIVVIYVLRLWWFTTSGVVVVLVDVEMCELWVQEGGGRPGSWCSMAIMSIVQWLVSDP